MKSVNRRWGSVSSAWLNHTGIGLDEFAVLSYLATCMAPDGSAIEPSQGEIARCLKVSRSTISRIISHLCEMGILVKERRCKTGVGEISCVYRIQVDADGAIVAPAVLVPSVLRQICGEPVSQTDTPLSPSATTPVSDCDTNQDSKIQTPTPTRKGAGFHESGFGRIGREEGRGDLGRSCIPAPTSEKPPVTKTIVDEKWVPSSNDIAWSAEHCPDLDILVHTQLYITACRSKGLAYADHGATWRNWALKDARDAAFRKQPAPGTRQGRGASPPRTPAGQSLGETNAAAAAACLDRIAARQARREAWQ